MNVVSLVNHARQITFNPQLLSVAPLVESSTLSNNSPYSSTNALHTKARYPELCALVYMHQREHYSTAVLAVMQSSEKYVVPIDPRASSSSNRASAKCSPTDIINQRIQRRHHQTEKLPNSRRLS